MLSPCVTLLPHSWEVSMAYASWVIESLERTWTWRDTKELHVCDYVIRKESMGGEGLWGGEEEERK